MTDENKRITPEYIKRIKLLRSEGYTLRNVMGTAIIMRRNMNKAPVVTELPEPPTTE